MTTSTRVEVSKELVDSTVLTFIKAMEIKVSIALMKPRTRLYGYFDGVSVDQYLTPTDGVKGDPIITDQYGAATAVFSVPAQKFKTGLRELVFLESPEYKIVDVYGTTAGFARANFFAYGSEEKWQATETTIKTVTITEVRTDKNSGENVPAATSPTSSSNTSSAVNNSDKSLPTETLPTVSSDVTSVLKGDPLAQTFFTFGVRGGCYVTGIDLYFAQKDDNVPVWLELRKTRNGIPTEELVNEYAISIITPEEVNVSEDASKATLFRFSRMIYLEEDSEWAFVVQSKSNQYLVWTSKVEEKSVETNQIISSQPFNGAMYKSENNHTWLIEPTEDVKFKIYKAQFDNTVQASINLPFSNVANAVATSCFQTLNSASDVFVNLPFRHGLDLNSKVSIGAMSDGVYNGIPGSTLHGVHSVTRIISPYAFGINLSPLGAVATRTGPITSGGKIRRIEITSGGSGYNQNSPPTVTITGGEGTGFVGNAIITDGAVTGVEIVNGGTGFVSRPTVEFTFPGTSVGSGAAGIAVIAEQFTVTTNRVYNNVSATWDRTIPDGTKIKANLSTTKASYPSAPDNNYTPNLQTFEINPDEVTNLPDNLLVASRENEYHAMGNNRSGRLNLILQSENANVSPVVDINDFRLMLKGYDINSQVGEVIESTEGRGVVTNINLTFGGSGYTLVPTVLIYGGVGEGATASCTLSGGSVDTVTITNPGSGFLQAPKVIFLPQENGTAPTGFAAATATATISNYNSEIAPENGTAIARYVTKPQALVRTSTGARVIVEAYSNAASSFEVYIKTSLAINSSNHDEQKWIQLQCPVARNQSVRQGEFKEYEFNIDRLPEFDLYTLKIVLRSNTPWDCPIINNYRAILVS